MRTVKILLIIVLLAVSVLYGITTVSEKFTGAHVPPTGIMVSQSFFRWPTLFWP